MGFNHLRIIVVILAALAGFFGYLCRLNLSLAINEMVVKGSDGQPLEPQTDATRELDELAKRANQINYEDQAVAFLSHPSKSYYWKQAGPTAKKYAKERKRIQPLRKPFPFGLSIDISSNDTKIADETKSDEVVEKRVVGGTLLNWNEEDKNNILTAFFYGYVVFQIPGGRAAELFGAKTMFVFMGIGTTLMTLVFPHAAKTYPNIHVAFASRVVMGATQGVMFPAAYVLLCEWLPRKERSRWLAIPSSFSRLGTIAMNLIVPFILRSYTWEYVFYFCGLVTFVWTILFLTIAANKPSASFWISDRELMDIDARMEPSMATKQQPSLSASGFTINEPARKPSLSWGKLLTNRPLLILSLVMFTSEWSNMLLLIKLPGFLGSAMKMSIEEIGLWSSFLIGIYCIQYPLAGFCASKLECDDEDEENGLSSLRIRKIFEAAAHLMQASGCLIIAFFNQKYVVIGALFLMMFGRSTVGGGQCLMPPELSKDYSGTVMAVANSIANLAGIIGPIVVTHLVSDPEDFSSWTNLWLLSAAVFLIGGLIFCLFADNGAQNYCKKAKLSGSISQAQLHDSREPFSEMIKMSAVFGAAPDKK